MFSKDVDLDYSIVLKNKIPLLVHDEGWKAIFENTGDKGINSCKKELQSLLDEEKRTNKEVKELKIQKKKLMDKVLKVSHEVNKNNSKEHLDDLEKCKRDILMINDRIDQLTFQLEMTPKKIKEANYRLLVETVKYAYKQLKTDQDKLKTFNAEIEALRNKLRVLIEEKNDCEERVNDTYSFLHGVLGNKVMENLDKDML